MTDDTAKQLPEERLEPEDTFDSTKDQKSGPTNNEAGDPGRQAEPETAGNDRVCSKSASGNKYEGKTHKGRYWLLLVLLLVIVISICNTLWNKMEEKMDSLDASMAETMADQAKTLDEQNRVMDEIKSELNDLKKLSDTRQAKIIEVERYVASVKERMKEVDSEVNNMQVTSDRHEEWLEKDLDAKRAEAEKLQSLISELENILDSDKTAGAGSE